MIFKFLIMGLKLHLHAVTGLYVHDCNRYRIPFSRNYFSLLLTSLGSFDLLTVGAIRA